MTVRTAPSMRVKDAMIAQPISISPSASPRELARLLLEHNISGVPVVDADGDVVGVASKTDLLQWCVRGGLGFGANDLLMSLADGGKRLEPVDLGIVADFMTQTALFAEPHEPLIDVARRMAEHQVHRLIVIDEAGSLQGIITSMDLLRVFPPTT
jgi:CBS domain-containing protein